MHLSVFLCFSTLAIAHAYSEPENHTSAPKDRDTLLRIQIFLDKNLFSPGKLDGTIGEFTHKAVVNYNFAKGHSKLQDWARVEAAAQQEVRVIFAAFKVTEDLFKFINKDLPDDPAKQAEFSFMGYRSLSELVAERFHTDETFLSKINPKKNIDSMVESEVIIVPNITPFKIEDVKPMQTFRKDRELSSNTMVIDTYERMGIVYNVDEIMIAAFPITPGKPQFIPFGSWTVNNMMTTPSFRYDKQFLEEGVRGEAAYQLPSGPNSPIGIIWCGLSKSGIGLHGTAFPRTIGRSRSAGCVRFANWDAIRLPSLIRPGTTVIVR